MQEKTKTNLSGLNEKQREAVISENKRLLVLINIPYATFRRGLQAH